MNIIIYLLFAAFAFTQVLDVYSTYRLIKDGTGYEANPIMACCIKVLGLLGGLIAPKLLMLLGVGYLLLCPSGSQYFGALEPWIVMLLLAALLVLCAYVVRNNFKILRGQ